MLRVDPNASLPRAFVDTDRYAELGFGECTALQRELAGRVIAVGDGSAIERVVGVDTAVDDETGHMFGAAAIVDASSGELVEVGRAQSQVGFEYVPGLLSFREVPLIVEALAALHSPFDLIMCDGHGLIHPRRFGLACHLGVLLSKRSVGVGKTYLLGDHDEPEHEKGAFADVVDEGEVVGRFVRTRDSIKPVYVSVGHLIDLDEATEIVTRLSIVARVPEPVRRADIEANAMRRRFRARRYPAG